MLNDCFLEIILNPKLFLLLVQGLQSLQLRNLWILSKINIFHQTSRKHNLIHRYLQSLKPSNIINEMAKQMVLRKFIRNLKKCFPNTQGKRGMA